MSAKDYCPKCSKPRYEGAFDCPFCGVVYDRFLPELPEDATVEPQLVLDAKLKWDGMDELYRGPAPPEDPVPGAAPRFRSTAGDAGAAKEEERETILTRNMGLSLVILGLLYLLVQAAWNTYLAGATVQPEEARARLAAVVGLDVPDILGEAGTVRFVGRNFLWFVDGTQTPPTTLVVYHRGRLAASRSESQMIAEFRGWMDGMGLDWRRVEKRSAQVRGQVVEVEIFAVGEEKGNLATLAALAPISASDGRPAIVFLLAPRGSFERLLGALAG